MARRRTFGLRAARCRFEREKLPGSYILELVDVPERTFTFSDPPSGRTVAIDLTGVPYLTLVVAMAAPFSVSNRAGA